LKTKKRTLHSKTPKNFFVNKNIILIVILIVISGSIYYLSSQKVQITKIVENLGEINIIVSSEYIIDEKAIKEKSKSFQLAPELVGIAGYLNTDEDISIRGLKGKVVLVDFWTYTCINCIRTFPFLRAWHEKYEDEGLVIIGVHTPEFEFEKEYDNVKNAIEEYELKYAVVQDNNYATWRAYKNRYWPRKYLVDIDGFIRYDHIGEGGYDETERVIQELLKERMERQGKEKIEDDMSKPVDVTQVDYRQIGTPEIYLGYTFARGNFGNSQGLPPEEIVEYKIPAIVNPNKVYLEGTWKINGDDSELLSDVGRIMLGYDAKVVNFVALSESGSEIEVFFDTHPLDEPKLGADVEIVDGKSIFIVQEGRLYNIVDYQYGPGLLELIIKGKGFKINAFTFG